DSINHSTEKLILIVQGQIEPLRERSPTLFIYPPLLIQDSDCTDSNKECFGDVGALWGRDNDEKCENDCHHDFNDYDRPEKKET
ncbi:hypothetical protein Bpfe_002704, partial [Biomphalaria pfeifferi]